MNCKKEKKNKKKSLLKYVGRCNFTHDWILKLIFTTIIIQKILKHSHYLKNIKKPIPFNQLNVIL